MIRVIHLSSAHPMGDNRINIKECRSLAEAGYEVVLVGTGRAPDWPGDPIRYREVPTPRNRLTRALFTAPRIAVTARRLRPRVCHLHDPELLFIAPLLRRGGTKVVYDAHEELAKQVLSKPWIPERLRRFVSAIVSHTLPVLLRWVDAIVAATPKIAEGISGRVVVVANYPKKGEFVAGRSSLTRYGIRSSSTSAP